MNAKNLKLAAMLLLSLNSIESPLSAENITSSISDYFNSKLHPATNATINISLVTGLIGLAATSQYVATTYLVQESQLVQTKYPHAQAWYEALAEKYPAANLNSKLFLQTMRGIPAKFMSWCSTMNQIYFPQDALKDINNIYKKQLDGLTLTEEEMIFLGMQEFVLLHEAGHIEHNDMTKRYLTLIGVFATLETVRAICRTYYANNSASQKANLSYEEQAIIKVYNDFMIFAEFIALDFILPVFIRAQEFAADAFAYKQIDENALKGGIAFFENEEIDPLFNIENQHYSPFIKVDSTTGTAIQQLVTYTEEPAFYREKAIKKMIASNSYLRWLYDYYRGSSHPGPSVRAQNIKNELASRDLDSK